MKCKELILDRKGSVHIVFELLQGGNLETLTRKRKEPFTEHQIRSVFYQLLLATRHMHAMRYMHRDIKPENVLVKGHSLSGDIRIKLADLGLAKFCETSNSRPQTTYVSTRWYRSPEILLRLANYSYPSDMWAIGAVMAELVCLGEPLFPGDNEKDQLARVVALRGHPAMVGWQNGVEAMKHRRVKLPKSTPSSLRGAISRASLPVLQLISDLLEMDPTRRPSASAALQYPLFLAQHPDIDEAIHTSKRRKLDSVDLDTGRTRDFPSSRWSNGTDAEDGSATRNLKTHRFSVGEGKNLHLEHLQEDRSIRQPSKQEQLFSIPEYRNMSDDDLHRSPPTNARRRPAGQFEMRV